MLCYFIDTGWSIFRISNQFSFWKVLYKSKHVGLKMCAGFHRQAVTDTSFQLVNRRDPLLCDLLSECYKDIVTLTFRRRIKSRLPFSGIIRKLPYSTRFQDKG